MTQITRERAIDASITATSMLRMTMEATRHNEEDQAVADIGETLSVVLEKLEITHEFIERQKGEAA